MAALDSILREKHLRRMQRVQQLSEARSRCEISAQASAVAERLHEEARAFLWQTMTASDLCIQRLSVARAQDGATRAALDGAAKVHARNEHDAEKLQQALARIEKDIEKLTERRDQLRQAAAAEHVKREWRDMDDWVLSRRGAAT